MGKKKSENMYLAKQLSSAVSADKHYANVILYLYQFYTEMSSGKPV